MFMDCCLEDGAGRSSFARCALRLSGQAAEGGCPHIKSAIDFEPFRARLAGDAERLVPASEELTSGAEARKHFRRLSGTLRLRSGQAGTRALPELLRTQIFLQPLTTRLTWAGLKSLFLGDGGCAIVPGHE
jgi:hypothetical protein